MDIEQTPSWNAAQAAKEAWRTAFLDPNMSTAGKATTRTAYASLMLRCNREVDGVSGR